MCALPMYLWQLINKVLRLNGHPRHTFCHTISVVENNEPAHGAFQIDGRSSSILSQCAEVLMSLSFIIAETVHCGHMGQPDHFQVVNSEWRRCRRFHSETGGSAFNASSTYPLMCAMKFAAHVRPKRHIHDLSMIC